MGIHPVVRDAQPVSFKWRIEVSATIIATYTRFRAQPSVMLQRRTAAIAADGGMEDDPRWRARTSVVDGYYALDITGPFASPEALVGVLGLPTWRTLYGPPQIGEAEDDGTMGRPCCRRDLQQHRER